MAMQQDLGAVMSMLGGQSTPPSFGGPQPPPGMPSPFGALGGNDKLQTALAAIGAMSLLGEMRKLMKTSQTVGMRLDKPTQVNPAAPGLGPQDIQARIPAALGANGNIKADVRDFGGTVAPAPAVAGIPKTETALGTDSISAASISAAAVTKIRDGLLSYVYGSDAEGDRTVVGLVRRLGWALERASGLKGSTAAYLNQAGTTIWSIVQSVTNGTRGAINLGDTEDPP